jgi:hypothetical protein
MLLEDEGWDLDLLSNRNSVSQRIRKLRPYKLRMLRRLRRLRRLRLMSINLFLHRSKNIEKILKDQEYQGRNHSMLSLIKIYNKEAIDTRPLPTQSLSSIINFRINGSRYSSYAANSKNYQCEPQLLVRNPNLRYPVSIYKNLNKREAVYLIKHSDNKLNFIVN